MAHGRRPILTNITTKMSRGFPRQGPRGKHKYPPLKNPIKSQAQLNNLARWAIPRGANLNPYGTIGCRHTDAKDDLALRKHAMKRTRIKLKQKKAVAMEAHELQVLARENASLAMQTLIEIAANSRAPEATRIAASAVILDRGFGKASQTNITANIGNGKNNNLTATELDQRVAKALRRVEELTNRAPKQAPSPQRPADLRKLN